MWPFKKENNREKFVQEFTHAIAQTWLNIPQITSLLPDNLTTFRFVFNSYLLALIFHELECGKCANADLHLLTSAFPKSNEPQKISDVLISSVDLWDFPEHIRVISGLKEFPDHCSDLELPPNLIMLGVYFSRSAKLKKYLDQSLAIGSNTTEWDTDQIFIASGVQLVNQIFSETLESAKNVQEYAAITLNRAAIFQEYSRSLYRIVLPISKKHSSHC